jgi:release factor glutamine methyltransferase
MNGPPYLSSEDSALIRDVLSRYHGESALEIGAGNGGNLVALSEKFSRVVGTDLVRPTMEDWKENGDYVLADAGGCFRPATFDLVAFNPPYLPEEAELDVTVQGGEDLRVPKEFLRQAIALVKRSGTVVFLLNGEAMRKEFEEVCAESSFKMKKVGERKLFFEVLSVYEASASG